MQALFAKLSALFLLGATVCLIVGVATPYWVSDSGHTSGLWQSCFFKIHESRGAKTCSEIDKRADFADWFKAVRALEILACIGGLVSFLVMIIYLCKNDGQSNLNRIKLVMLLCLLSCILSLSGVILYGSKKGHGYFGNKYLSWSFVLTTISGCVYGLILLPLWIEIRQARRLGTYESI